MQPGPRYLRLDISVASSCPFLGSTGFQLSPESVFHVLLRNGFYPILYLCSQTLTLGTESSLSPLSAAVGDATYCLSLILATWMVSFCLGASDPTMLATVSGVMLRKQTWLSRLPFSLGGLNLSFAFVRRLCWKAIHPSWVLSQGCLALVRMSLPGPLQVLMAPSACLPSISQLLGLSQGLTQL